LQPEARCVVRGRRSERGPGSSIEDAGDPDQEVCADFTTVDLIQHFVPSSRVRIKGDVTDSRFVIAIYQDADTGEPFPNGIVAAGEYVHRKVLTYLGEPGWFGKLSRRCEMRERTQWTPA